MRLHLIIILLTACFIQLAMAADAQNVTLSKTNAPLTEVLKEIRKQTGFDFAITNAQVKVAKPISIQVTGEALKNVLNQCFSGQPFSYTIENKTIIVVPKKEAEKTKVDVNVPITISGKVVDTTGQPLPGATIRVNGTKQAIRTDNKGEFAFSLPDNNEIIQVGYIGYQTKDILITESNTNMVIVLKISTSQLDQVQIVAYGQKTSERYNVGSIATVTAKQIETQPVSNPLLALEGQVPGLTITPTSGVPGSTVLVQIRGQNTLSVNPLVSGTGPLDEPLFIIDGVIFAPQNQNINQFNSIGAPGSIRYYNNPFGGQSPFNSINPMDIESISVLKDADATSIYGSQGANGAILITTKRGKAGKVKLNFSASSGYNRVTSPVQMMNTQQYTAMLREGINNDGFGSYLTPANAPYFADLLIYNQNKSTDWFKEFEGGTAKQSTVNASLSGGTIDDNFYLGTGYNNQDYNFPGNFADNRVSINSSFQHQSSDQKFKIEFGTYYSYDQNNSSGAPSVLKAFSLAPNIPDFVDSQGNLVWNYKGYDFTKALSIQNPYAYLKQPADAQIYNLTSHVNLSYQLFIGFNFSTEFGYNKDVNQEYGALPLSSLDPNASTEYISSASRGLNNFEGITVTPQLSYNRAIGKGIFSVLFGGDYQKLSSFSTEIFGKGFANDALLHSISAAATTSAEDNSGETKYIGAHARINYIWDKKYIVNLTGNKDGSSNFGPGRQYGNFGSVAGGWIISEESFFKQFLPFISFTKLSASYGTTGSYGVGPYQYQPNWETNPSGTLPFQGIRGYSPINLDNPDFSWDLAKKFNSSLDMRFLQDRFGFNVTWYKSIISNQLISSALPIITGFSSIIENFPATVQNTGWEITVNSQNIKSNVFNWSTSFNISANQNKLIAFPGLQTSSYANEYVIGKPTSEFPVVKYEGVNPTTGLFQYLTANGKLTSAPNGSSVVNGGDANQYINLTPKFIGGFTNTFTYRGFTLTAFFQFAKQIGANYLSGVYRSGNLPGTFGVNFPVQLENAWHKPGDVSQFELYSYGANQAAINAATSFLNSTGAYSDASYIRLKNLAFAYNIPSNYLKKVGIQGCSIYINAQNLLTITPYSVGDPETQTLYGIPPQKTIVAGLNFTF